MEEVAAAIDGVKKAAQKNRDKAVVAAIDDLSSTLRLLQLSSSSTKTHSTLCKLFVEKLGALYTAFPHLMCRYAAAVLTAIFQEKIKPAFDTEDLKLQSSWENVQKSVVSGVIDFLEEKSDTSAPSNASNKGAAAEYLYPVICAIFYPPKPRVEWRTSGLIFNVNLLLYETVTRHPANQTSLRSEKVLGPTRIGLALSQNRDFIILDSLLLLIGALLPSRQKPAKRSSFVDDVFKPELFRQSDEIKNLIASSTDSQWDPVAVKIINSLAGSDLSFPQPFYISKLRASIELPKFAASDPVYLDERSLFANVDQDNESMLGSFQVLFVNIKQIKIGGPGNPPTLVAISVNAEADASEGPGQQWTVQFQLKHADTGRFAQTFKERGLSRLISEPKISKLGEPLGLTFDSTQQYPPSRQEKVDKLQHVWDSGRPTSPLVSDPSKTPDQKHDSPQAASSIHEAIDGDALTDMSENEENPVSKPKRPTSKPKPPPSPAPPVPTVESDEEDDVPRKARTKNRKNRVVESEDEDEDNNIKDSQSSPPPSNLKDQDFEPTQPDAEHVPVDVPARVTRGAVKKNPALADDAAALKSTGKQASALTAVTGEDGTSRGRSIRRAAARKSAVDKELTLSDDDIEDEKFARGPTAVDVKSQRTSNEKAGSETREVTAVKSGFKRVNSNDDPRPTKRVRRPTSAVLELSETMPPLRRDSAIVFGTVAPPARKRYGGKRGRTSSPVPDSTAGDVDMNVDFDELPGAHSPPPSPVPVKAPKAVKHEYKAMNEPQTRVAAMKGKGGQKPAAKGPLKATKPAPRAKAKAKTEPEISTEVVEEIEPGEIKPLRRSGRGSNAAPQEEKPTVDTVPKSKATKKAEKPRKAPWEDMHLLKKEAATPTDGHLPQTDADAVAQDDVEFEAFPDAFEEYDVPLKGSTDPLPFPEDDAPMVDLTHDTPPRTTEKQPEVNDPSPVVPDVTRTRPLDSAPMRPTTTSTSFVLATPAVPVALASAPATVPLKSTLAVPRSPKPLLPSDPSPSHITHPIYPSTVTTKLAALPIIPDVTPIRLQLHSAAASVEAGLAPQPPVTKFESDVPLRSNKPAAFLPPTTSPPPQVSPRKPSPSANSLRLNKPAPLQLIEPRHLPESPVAPAHHQVIYDSPFPKRVDQATTIAPSRTSTPADQRTAHALPIRKTVQYTAYEDTPDLGRPSRTFGRAPFKHEVDGRDHHTKRNRSPMQGILEILNEIQDVVVEKIHQRFDHVKKDVRIGRDTILRTATTNLEGMCVESERHFNNLVDLEKDYAGYHRDIISGIDDVHKSAQVMSNALGKIVQQHDRGSLSKKLPPSLFSLPSTIRKPLVL
ncbi:hypothetical protein R3P38DRAFT_2980291 [Favolaschia claudopus]|uniref:Uncharacterized protein n=1 Tax=Favolaschia claudopus TaxID=2862362 RepID=A0AAW0AZJ0_9AGAR